MKARTHFEENGKSSGEPCLWMQAGVVKHKICRTCFECATCQYDRALMHVAEKNCRIMVSGGRPRGRQGHIMFWKDRMRGRPPSRRPCVHHMKKRIDFRSCDHDYRCSDCEFDQYFMDQFAVHAVVLPVGFQDVDGFKLPQGYYLHPGHAWARIEDGDEVRIGIDDFAQKLFGPFDHIESPLVGKEVTAGTPAIVVRHGNRSARILSPVNGVVTSINTDLRNNGVSSVDDPYTAGWVMRVRADTPRQDIAAMLIGPEAGAWIKTEVKRLYRIIEEDAGPLAADGGFLSNDIMSRLPALDWDRMACLFLKT